MAGGYELRLGFIEWLLEYDLWDRVVFPCGVVMSIEPVIYVVDDDEAVRSSVHLLLEPLGCEIQLCASAESLWHRADLERPAVLVLDLRLTGQGGLEVQREVGRRGLAWPIVIITGHGEVPVAVHAMKAGAVEFLEKPFDPRHLVETVRSALDRARQAWQERSQQQASVERFGRLTRRERQVFHCVVAGKPNKTIAEELGVSVKTIEAHRARMMRKAEVDSLADLVRLAMEITGSTDESLTPA